MNKNLMIGLGVLAVAGIGLYVYNKNRKKEQKSEVRGISDKNSLSQNTQTLSKSVSSKLVAPKGYEYYPAGSNRENCGSGCKYWAGICWCLKLGKASGTSGLGGECPAGTQCCSRIQTQCVQCCPAGSGVRV